MRPTAALSSVFVCVVGGCSVASLFDDGIRCTDDGACPDTAPFCVEFRCAVAGDEGEGEGDVEGEGEGEGEGDVEGEGEGEGEGDVVGEGEGEGDIVGEGEGEGSTFVGNDAPRGGVVDVNCASSNELRIVNTTLVSNAQPITICGDEHVVLEHCSVSDNRGEVVSFGSFDVAPGSLIVADSAIRSASRLCVSSDVGDFVSRGHNVGVYAEGPCAFDPNQDIDADPGFFLLADNGGPTRTVAIGADSPARDAADDARCPDTDQRGVARVACDAGAFEFVP